MAVVPPVPRHEHEREVWFVTRAIADTLHLGRCNREHPRGLVRKPECIELGRDEESCESVTLPGVREEKDRSRERVALRELGERCLNLLDPLRRSGFAVRHLGDCDEETATDKRYRDLGTRGVEDECVLLVREGGAQGLVAQ